KGQIVREIDALGGEMARATDATGIQFRILNTGKGPAVRAPRAQVDRAAYVVYMCDAIRRQPGLDLVVGEASEVLVRAGRATGVRLRDGREIAARAVVVTAGTFLRGLMHVGDRRSRGGRFGEPPSDDLSGSLAALGFERARLKTGTPPRLDRRTIDYARLDIQRGDDPPRPFSHFTRAIDRPQVPCHTTHTTAATHDCIRRNLHRSPLFGGAIVGVGPRYCPSIEDKVVRFAGKDRHLLFLEPEGLDTDWVYANGISTSLPADVQEAIVASIPGLERARILRHGYAIEYDVFPPTQIGPTFETKAIENLFFAGQICGTSGYEEAAGQGLLAGANAVLRIRGESPLVLDRAEAYLGVLADDLVGACPREPYRMFTSRAEFRLLLRMDNADLRLMPHGRRLGLIPEEAAARAAQRRARAEATLAYLDTHLLEGVPLIRLLRRPGESFDAIARRSPELAALSPDRETRELVEVEAKYAGYIARQRAEVDRFRRLEEKRIPPGIDYGAIPGLRSESREKLARVRPLSVGQASRIAGVTPADIAILLVHLRRGAGRIGA
ncbi:MAG: tRNA uridine-5-carboxymethylaminomethyl(34) synthesis enzyme MnmG, partial [Planctomycetes bacterium]|nr:tRNA uridine-5-carboxymethylaminomethyl(34) synthesis enzyme MnmG [Planctomycetota bacterium]